MLPASTSGDPSKPRPPKTRPCATFRHRAGPEDQAGDGRSDDDGTQFPGNLAVDRYPADDGKASRRTPADWKQGEDVIITSSVSDDEAKTIYPQGWKSPKPYMRIVPQPMTRPRSRGKRATETVIPGRCQQVSPKMAGPMTGSATNPEGAIPDEDTLDLRRQPIGNEEASSRGDSGERQAQEHIDNKATGRLPDA